MTDDSVRPPQQVVHVVHCRDCDYEESFDNSTTAHRRAEFHQRTEAHKSLVSTEVADD